MGELRLIADTGPDTRNELKNEVAAAVGQSIVIEDAISDFSIMYKGKRRYSLQYVPVVVKVLIPSVRLEWIKDDFIQRASYLTRDLPDPCSIRILDTVSHGRIHDVVMEFIEAPTLATLLKQSPEGRLS